MFCVLLTEHPSTFSSRNARFLFVSCSGVVIAAAMDVADVGVAAAAAAFSPVMESSSNAVITLF